MNYVGLDADGELVPCGGKIVSCPFEGCQNFGIEMEVAELATVVICGGCEQVIEEN